MTETTLDSLAALAGLASEWTDFRGEQHRVSPDILRAILAAMGLPAQTASDIAESSHQLIATCGAAVAPLITADAGGSAAIAGESGIGRMTLDTGEQLDIELRPDRPGMVRFSVPEQPGYHRLEAGGRLIIVAAAPRRAWRIADLGPGRRRWGLAVQLYELRDGLTEGFGDYAALARFAPRAAAAGADALAISPTHALFAAEPSRCSPYAPSTRLFHNVLYADPGGDQLRSAADEGALIDWQTAGVARIEALRASYDRFARAGKKDREAFAAFVAEGGERLLNHARFETLDGRFRPQGLYHWRDWPDGFAEIASEAVQALHADQPEVEFYLYLQFLAERGLAEAQRAAREAGMAIGLIADLAVGMDGAGSHAWSRPKDVLTGVSIGAPPDPLGPEGQNWGLTAFSPPGLVASGFDAFLSTLRVAMRHAGGVRIDHAMGLERLWVVPEGAKAIEGTYLTYPFTDLLRLTALESWRHRAIVVGEDLGTVPSGFRERTTDAGVLGMRVLWFVRTWDDRLFRPPSTWDTPAAALTTTHDLPTVAGWWKGRDIDWRLKVDGNEDRAKNDRRERTADRRALWSMLRDCGAAEGEEPGMEAPDRVVDGALRAIADTPCDLALIPVEDVLGLDEQPNLPGTIDEHPNWRRRLPSTEVLEDSAPRRRLEALRRARP